MWERHAEHVVGEWPVLGHYVSPVDQFPERLQAGQEDSYEIEGALYLRFYRGLSEVYLKHQDVHMFAPLDMCYDIDTHPSEKTRLRDDREIHKKAVQRQQKNLDSTHMVKVVVDTQEANKRGIYVTPAAQSAEDHAFMQGPLRSVSCGLSHHISEQRQRSFTS